METLYRKVAVSEREPKEGWVLTPNGGFLFMDNKWKCTHSGQEQEDDSFTHWLEPIKSNSTQIEKLEADKAELLKALEKARIALNKWDDELSYDIYDLIQKMKQ